MKVHLPIMPYIRRAQAESHMRWPHDGAPMPEHQTCSLWVSLKLIFPLMIPFPPTGRELFQTVLQAGTGMDQPPASLQRISRAHLTPVHETAVRWCPVVSAGSILQRFCFSCLWISLWWLLIVYVGSC